MTMLTTRQAAERLNVSSRTILVWIERGLLSAFHDLVFGGVQDFKQGFAGACRRAGIEDFHPHDLRHTCASWLVMSGVPLYEVRDILGHASITQTERYSHLAHENLAAAIGRL